MMRTLFTPLHCLRRVTFLVMVIATAIGLRSADAIDLTRGTPTTLTGTLGDVQVNYVDDSVSLSQYVDGSGLVMLSDPDDYIATRRVQYDALNMSGNGSIFEFRVDYAPGAELIGAANPNGFFDSGGEEQTYWSGSGNTLLFDSGLGTYDYDLPFGGEWAIEYAADHVLWRHLGNGFFPGTATGATEFGLVPSFALYFEPDTPLGLQASKASGFDSESSGRVLSAVALTPEGDYNGNGTVEQRDLDLLLLHWGAEQIPDGWVHHLPDGRIDQEELDAVLLNWGGTVDDASPPTSGPRAARSRAHGNSGRSALRGHATARASLKSLGLPT